MEDFFFTYVVPVLIIVLKSVVLIVILSSFVAKSPAVPSGSGRHDDGPRSAEKA